MEHSNLLTFYLSDSFLWPIQTKFLILELLVLKHWTSVPKLVSFKNEYVYSIQWVYQHFNKNCFEVMSRSTWMSMIIKITAIYITEPKCLKIPNLHMSIMFISLVLVTTPCHNPWYSGYHIWLTRRRSPVRAWAY